jgi:hypothetical protein
MWSYACPTAAEQIVSIEILSVRSRVSGGTVAVTGLAEDDNRKGRMRKTVALRHTARVTLAPGGTSKPRPLWDRWFSLLAGNLAVPT